ncbi:MAG: outer membrane beta-barrel protein [Bacteroidales bacterium]|jgi:opacity protein-like surface antigen|nr:outer membrane beta-barrel protein [Bacteroidales bacterium]
MKKILIVAGLMLAGVCASAQNYFGVTGGYNLSTLKMEELTGDPYGVKTEHSPRSGFNAGIAYEHRFTGSDKGNLFIGANVLYSLEGYHYKTTIPTGVSDIVLKSGSDAVYEDNVDFKYLKLPVSFGYNFKLSDNFGLAPKVFGILESQLDIVHDDVNPVFDFAFGAGVNLNIGERLSIGLGYDWNLENDFEPNIRYGNAHANVSYYIFSTK